MLARFLSEPNRIHELGLTEADFVLLDHPLDTLGDGVAVARLEDGMNNITCPKMLEDAKKEKE